MADDILSQEEVDALLRGVTGDDNDDEARLGEPQYATMILVVKSALFVAGCQP